MVRKLLIFCTHTTKQASARHSEVMTLQVSLLRDDKELLLKSQGQEDVPVLDT
jgi:hypothetical protein